MQLSGLLYSDFPFVPSSSIQQNQQLGITGITTMCILYRRHTSATQVAPNSGLRLLCKRGKNLHGAHPTGTDAFCCIKGIGNNYISFSTFMKEELWYREVRRPVQGNTRLPW